jgi:hypothetical protein
MTPARTGVDGLALDALRIGTAVVLALLSFHLVERPIRTQRVLRGRRALAASPAAIALATNVAIVGTQGALPLPKYYDTRSPALAATSFATGARRAMLVGDSIGSSLAPGFDAEARRRGITFVNAAHPGCAVVRGTAILGDGSPMPGASYCDGVVPAADERSVRTFRPHLVIWLSLWETLDRRVDGKRLQVGSPRGNEMLSALLDEAILRLTAGGAHLVILLPAQSTPDGILPDYDYAARLRRVPVVRQLLAEAAGRHVGLVSMVDLEPVVCPGGPPCSNRVGGVELRPDGSHFGARGARYVGRRLASAVFAPLPDAPIEASR